MALSQIWWYALKNPTIKEAEAKDLGVGGQNELFSLKNKQTNNKNPLLFKMMSSHIVIDFRCTFCVNCAATYLWELTCGEGDSEGVRCIIAPDKEYDQVVSFVQLRGDAFKWGSW